MAASSVPVELAVAFNPSATALYITVNDALMLVTW
jgi:hypothetical protein